MVPIVAFIYYPGPLIDHFKLNNISYRNKTRITAESGLIRLVVVHTVPSSQEVYLSINWFICYLIRGTSYLQTSGLSILFDYQVINCAIQTEKWKKYSEVETGSTATGAVQEGNG